MIVWICDIFALKSMKSSNIWILYPFFQLRLQFIITLQKKSQSPIQPNQIILDFSQIYTRLFQKSDNTFSEVHEHRNFSLTDCSIQLEMVFYLTAEPFFLPVFLGSLGLANRTKQKFDILSLQLEN